MDTEKMKRKAGTLLQKYKYAALVVCIGVALMLLPSGQKRESTASASAQTQPTQAPQETDLAAELAQLLTRVSGAGKVEVLLSVAEGEKVLYQFDAETNTSGSANSVRQQTVIVTDSDRNEQAVISQTIPPVYLGAVVVCQGADQPAVQLAIVEAVSKATGLGADRICVLKMK